MNTPRAFLYDLLPVAEIESLQNQINKNETTLWKYWPEFIEKYARTGKSLVTIKGVRDGLRFAVRKLNIYTIEQLNNPRLLEEALFAYKEANDLKNTTYNSYRKNFNTFCIWLEKFEYIAENKIGKVQKCTEEQNEHLTLNEEQIKQVLAQVYDRKQRRLERLRNVFFIDLLRVIGARPCEMLGMKMEDIQKESGNYIAVIRGRKQKGRIRYYPLEGFAKDSYEFYMTYREKFRPNEKKLFHSSSKKSGWTNGGMRRLFDKLSKELGFRVNAYAFRRYVATRLYNKGMPIEKISQYLGHTRITTTHRYIARSCALTKDCMDIMGN